MLSKVLGRIVMAILFFAVVTPVGLVMRMAGRDPLRRRLDREASSYWLVRDTTRNERQTSMTRQF
ncbi:MAG TPA: hypothetical protein VNV39_14265 [Stellaceae bacterium]|jgi:hypothetical protein|nr:hypothetical protein [Stellaceae bacterium]